MSARRLFALLSCALAACSSAASLTQAQFISQASTAYCTKVLGCCAGQPGVPTEAACETAFGAQLQTRLTAQLAISTTTFNGTAAASCISEASAASCGALALSNVATPDCNLVVSGTQANAGACTDGNSCASELCINIPFDGGVATGPGDCAAPAAVNQPCPGTLTDETSGYDCVTGAYPFYGSTSGTETCTCTATLPNGASCSQLGSSACTSGYCDQGTGQCAAATVSATLTAQQCTSLFSPQGN